MNFEQESPLVAADVAPLYEESESCDGNSSLESPSNLPTIIVKGGGLSDEATQAEEALIEVGAQIYQRDMNLVRPVIQDVMAAKGKRANVAQLVAIKQDYLIDILCQSAYWKKYNKDMVLLKINPPKQIAQVILERFGEWKFPIVIGIITTPTLRPDGSILDIPGYDEATRLILIDPPKLPTIPDHPTKQDALEALNLLDGLLTEFPFVNEESRSVALSVLITPIVRGAMSVVPLHAVNASTPGTGKSYLLDVSAAIISGQPCPVMAAGRNEEETEKRLGASLIVGQPIISIDNVNGDLGGDSLCQAVERPIVNVRILGKSEQVRIESRATIFATGNNIRLVGDMNRRVIMCTLDANQERPELREFKNNPVDTVLADRGKYIAAALTIVRAYIVAGGHNTAPKLASFEEWSDLVRSSLIWLGKADPVKTMEAARADDPFLQAMSEVFVALKNTIGESEPKTAAEIIKVALEKDGIGTEAPYKNPELREALMSVVSDRKGYIIAKELGKWFGRNQGRIVNGLRLYGKSDAHGHAAKWWIEEIAVEAVESG